LSAHTGRSVHLRETVVAVPKIYSLKRGELVDRRAIMV
jgi:hypothetical protein